MGVITITEEHSSEIPAARLFKALVLDAHNLIPKIIPHTVKSIEIVQGDGGPGSIKQINFAQGSQLNYVKHRIDELDENNYKYSYTLIEGDALILDKLESISYEIKLEANSDGGSKNKVTSKYYTKGDENDELTKEKIKEGKEKASAMYKVVEAYLLQNPDA